ncbi:POU domain, class 4, transcription factor 3-like isoform X2 [Xenia sp. Carnegie-2017]|uniref:POU domain, class 4, transcription factor 3-like isoform X2 n=1 Tax=Xenia sp. Carnegie-2017 TaxID=2897299 RepID=UPI001F038812|nr:POU domain, class 4, transcription factor 3-like isoform X2 [Xenia sp. Carnegie-2017]
MSFEKKFCPRKGRLGTTSNGIPYSNTAVLSASQSVNEASWIPSYRGSNSLTFSSRSQSLIPSNVFDNFDDPHLLAASQTLDPTKYLTKSPASSKSASYIGIHGLHSSHGQDTNQYDPHDILDQISASLQPSVSENFDKTFEKAFENSGSPSLSTQPSHHVFHAAMSPPTEDMNPRELEWFAERFKQRRIKLGVTQADVGAALANLKLAGVGSLSQSTICRFESLTLSHNNMMALKPVLTAWLEEAEKAYRSKNYKSEFLPNSEKKRKRTSIGAAEKRSLEAYFAMNARPSSDKISSIADKLDLSKNVVRVWFCNQRQKKKRMKFSVH